jgi:rhamnopyranosyl-N-acetylglucosaminyl-diphospho-decaprenol beta-1,3/1,4-galactofuranosyltransferase
VNDSIASVTIAHNSAGALPRQIGALLAQTRPLQEIIVVDNASTDGTGAMLAERYAQVTVLRLPENLGAAGAWATGLSYAALERKHDWVWTFDDDSVPDPKALEILLRGLKTLGDTEDEPGMVATLPVERKTGSPYPPILWRDGFVKGSMELLNQPVWMADLVIASGCMLRRGMVEKIGLPYTDFFMDVFDLEYCIRARSQGYKIAVVTGAKLTHEIGNTRKINVPGYKRLWMNQPPWREYYISRNLAYLAWQLYPNLKTKISMGCYLAMHFGGVLLFSSDRPACAMRMIQGLGDGLRGRLGIRVKPGSDNLSEQVSTLSPTTKVGVRKV